MAPGRYPSKRERALLQKEKDQSKGKGKAKVGTEKTQSEKGGKAPSQDDDADALELSGVEELGSDQEQESGYDDLKQGDVGDEEYEMGIEEGNDGKESEDAEENETGEEENDEDDEMGIGPSTRSKDLPMRPSRSSKSRAAAAATTTVTKSPSKQTRSPKKTTSKAVGLRVNDNAMGGNRRGKDSKVFVDVSPQHTDEDDNEDQEGDAAKFEERRLEIEGSSSGSSSSDLDDVQARMFIKNTSADAYLLAHSASRARSKTHSGVSSSRKGKGKGKAPARGETRVDPTSSTLFSSFLSKPFTSSELLTHSIHPTSSNGHPSHIPLSTYRPSYPQYLFELSQSFSLLFYGVGSKHSLLNDFAKTCLCKRGETVMVDAFDVGAFGDGSEAGTGGRKKGDGAVGRLVRGIEEVMERVKRREREDEDLRGPTHLLEREQQGRGREGPSTPIKTVGRAIPIHDETNNDEVMDIDGPPAPALQTTPPPRSGIRTPSPPSSEAETANGPVTISKAAAAAATTPRRRSTRNVLHMNQSTRDAPKSSQISRTVNLFSQTSKGAEGQDDVMMDGEGKGEKSSVPIIPLTIDQEQQTTTATTTSLQSRLSAITSFYSHSSIPLGVDLVFPPKPPSLPISPSKHHQHHPVPVPPRRRPPLFLILHSPFVNPSFTTPQALQVLLTLASTKGIHLILSADDPYTLGRLWPSGVGVGRIPDLEVDPVRDRAAEEGEDNAANQEDHSPAQDQDKTKTGSTSELASSSLSFNFLHHHVPTFIPHIQESTRSGILSSLFPSSVLSNFPRPPKKKGRGYGARKGGVGGVGGMGDGEEVDDEALFEGDVGPDEVEASGGVSKEGMLSILKSVTNRSREIFLLLAKEQFNAAATNPNVATRDPSTPPTFATLASHLLSVSTDKFLATGEAQFETLLGEFRDHGVLGSRRGAMNSIGKGEGEWIWIRMRREDLEEVVREAEA